LYTTAEKRYPHEHFFQEKNVDNNRSELSGIVLFCPYLFLWTLVNRVQWILINQTWFTLSTNKDLSTPIDFKGHGFDNNRSELSGIVLF
jgi:hypothetical protein